MSICIKNRPLWPGGDEGEMQFDFICDFMKANNIKMEVGIYEDRIKINEKLNTMRKVIV